MQFLPSAESALGRGTAFHFPPIRSISSRMTALTDAAPGMAEPAIIRRYYLAMGVPFAIDLVTLAIYAAMHKVPQLVLPTLVLSVAFLVIGVGIGAHFLIRPIHRFLAGETTFAEAENALTNLPRRSAALVA